MNETLQSVGNDLNKEPLEDKFAKLIGDLVALPIVAAILFVGLLLYPFFRRSKKKAT